MSKRSLYLSGCSLLATGLMVTAAPAFAAGKTTTHSSSGAVQTQVNGSFEPLVVAKRIVDTRIGRGASRGKVAPGATLTFDAASARPVAGDPVQAVVLEVTAPQPTPVGSLSVFPGGIAWDGRVTMNTDAYSNTQQQLTIPLGVNGTVSIRNNSAAGIELIVDALGYYVAGQPVDGGGLYVAANQRIADTRTGLDAPKATIGAGKSVTIQLTGPGRTLPNGASAIVANIAVLSARRTGLLPITDGDGTPATKNLRFVGYAIAPKTLQTERLLKLGPSGTLTFTNSSAGSINLVVDLAGSFTAGQPTAYGSYVPVGAAPLVENQRITLSGQTAHVVDLSGVTTDEAMAADVLFTLNRPAQPVLLGLSEVGTAWNGSVQLSSGAVSQPTEYTVDQRTSGAVSLRSLPSAQVWLHGYLTGYYLNRTAA